MLKGFYTSTLISAYINHTIVITTTTDIFYMLLMSVKYFSLMMAE
jgi:hypothetical protein